MGFLKKAVNRVIPLKANMNIVLGDRIISETDRHCKGHAQLICREAFRVEEIRLEAKAVERTVQLKRDSKGHSYSDVHYYNLFAKDIQLSTGFDASAGYVGEYDFEVTIPRFAPHHRGGELFTTLNAVANVKERPDVTKEVNAFSSEEEITGGVLFNSWCDGDRCGSKLNITEDKLREVASSVEKCNFDILKNDSSLLETDFTRLISDPSYRAGYVHGLRSRIPKEYVAVKVEKLDGFEKKMRL